MLIPKKIRLVDNSFDIVMYMILQGALLILSHNISLVLELERTYYRKESKRPAISEPKQILDVVVCRAYYAKIHVFVYEKINQNKVMSGLTQYSKHKIFVLVPK